MAQPPSAKLPPIENPELAKGFGEILSALTLPPGSRRLGSFYIRHSAAMVTQLPQINDVYIVEYFMIVSATGVACFLLTQNEAAATVYGTSGLKPEVVSLAGLNSPVPVGYAVLNNTKMYVSSDAATNIIVIYSMPSLPFFEF